VFKFLIVILCSAPVGGAETASPILSLSDLIQIASHNNPAIRAAREQWLSIKAQVPAAETWEDPLIGFQRMNFQGGQSANYLTLGQNVPFPGKLSQSAKMKHHEAMIAYQRYRAQGLDVAAQIAIEYAQISWLRETATVLKKDADILREIAQVAQASVASGRATTDEALSAQASAIQIKNAAFEREQESLVAEESLNALLAKPAGTRWNLSIPNDPQEIRYSPQELDAIARKTSPDYMMALHEIMHAKAMIALDRLGFAPDFQFSATQEIKPYVTMMQESVYGLNLSIPLWFWKQESLLKAAKAHREEAQASSENSQNEIFRQVHSELIEVNLHRDLALSYEREIIPLAKGALKIAEKGYEAGQTDFAKLSEDVRALLDAQLKYPQEVELYGEHRAKLERALGGPIPVIEKEGAKQ
jgi:outer membrane protein TolC